jgi:hypothetical protein
MLHRMLSVVVIVVFALGTVVLADPPTVSIQPQATLDQIPNPPNGPPVTVGVVVTVVVNCGDSAPSGFELDVGVRQGDLASDSGGVFFPSTGGRQQVQVEAFGPFNPGEASASAVLACGALLEGEDLRAEIEISK